MLQRGPTLCQRRGEHENERWVVDLHVPTRTCVRRVYRPFSARATYSIISRPLWSAAVAVIIFVCITHRENAVNRMLSQPIFEPIARLTFGAH
jgi:hypothetical protein